MKEKRMASQKLEKENHYVEDLESKIGAQNK